MIDSQPHLEESTRSAKSGGDSVARCNVLGVGISAVNYEMVLQFIDHWIATKQSRYITVTGVHGVMESQRDSGLRHIHNRAGLVTPDGMPMVWLSRAQGQKHVSRVYGPELMLQTCRHSVDRGYRHFLYGGAEGVANQLKENLESRFPGIEIAGTYCPPFRPLEPEEQQEVIQTINQSRADIVWVGLSTPKQERWMAEYSQRLQPAVLIGVGAAFDFHTGRVRQAPRWIQQSGLEWLFRLSQDPKRLWKRYLTNNPLFVMNLMLDKLRLRDFGSIDPNSQGK